MNTDLKHLAVLAPDERHAIENGAEVFARENPQASQSEAFAAGALCLYNHRLKRFSALFDTKGKQDGQEA
jgi:hypothetical protein